MNNIEAAATEYLAKRTQMGSRKAAAHVIQTYGITSSQLSSWLYEHGQLLSQQSVALRQAAAEVA